MAPLAQERPCIHVSLFPGTEAALYRWVEIGAEEEGVPCQLAEEEGADLVALAYAAAQSSRFNIGVGVGKAQIVLHERHMPSNQPVLIFNYSEQPDYLCRLMGSNAARMIVRKPFRVADEPALFDNGDKTQAAVNETGPLAASEPPPADLTTDPAQISKLVAVVVRKLQERGIR